VLSVKSVRPSGILTQSSKVFLGAGRRILNFLRVAIEINVYKAL
jgi:hypothetical protein